MIIIDFSCLKAAPVPLIQSPNTYSVPSEVYSGSAVFRDRKSRRRVREVDEMESPVPTGILTLQKCRGDIGCVVVQYRALSCYGALTVDRCALGKSSLITGYVDP